MLTKQLPKHAYQADGVPTRRGGPQGCRHCPLPKSHAVHELPDTPADAVAADSRRLGERTD